MGQLNNKQKKKNPIELWKARIRELGDMGERKKIAEKTIRGCFSRVSEDDKMRKNLSIKVRKISKKKAPKILGLEKKEKPFQQNKQNIAFG